MEVTSTRTSILLYAFVYDPIGHHMVGCKIDAHAIRLHNLVPYILTSLFRSLCLCVATQLETARMVADDGDDNHKPEIKVQNPF